MNHVVVGDTGVIYLIAGIMICLIFMILLLW